MDDNNRKKLQHQFELNRLKNSTDNVIKDHTLRGFEAPIRGTEKIDTKSVQKITSGNDFVEKIAKARALKQAGKKFMGAIPMLGTAYAAMSGDPAMAAEELAGDIPVAGQVYEAIKPTDTGNVEEERQMIAERNARAAYDQSPAHQARLKALQQFGK